MWGREQKGLIGLDIGSTAVKLVELSGAPGSYELESIALAVVESPGNAAAYERAIAAVLDAAAVEGKRVATAVSGHHVAVRCFQFPKLAPSEIKGAIWYEGSQVIPFDIKDAYVDYSILGNGGDSGKTNVLFVAAGKDSVDFKTKLAERSGLEPRVVGVDALALLDAAFLQPDVPDPIAVVNIGARTSSIGIGKKGSVPFIRDVEVAGDAYTASIAEALGVTRQEAEEAKMTESDHNPTVIYAVDNVTRQLLSELSRSLAYYQTRGFGSKVEQILVCGGGSGLTGLTRSIEQATGIPTEQWGVLRHVKVDGRRFDTAAVQDLAPMASLAAALAMRNPVQ